MNTDELYTHDPSIKAANDIYSLYFIGWLLGFLAFIIGGVWASVEAKKGRGYVQSHFQFQHNVAKQGVVVFVACTLLIWGWHTLYDGRWLTLIVVVTAGVFVWWWLRRCIAGYRVLSAQRAIANPNTWGKPQAELTPTKLSEEEDGRSKIQ